ncbi:hypothetical protein AIOL_002820 [Candidatus Rhodobacter oscarellae]|uniref:Uncharacterized protein n=1 Tax=Candidatus Rhodobacter oscarellae TaxID=1675527 RepID=A0A0J9E541_9RHOB|nr:hypothetical protein [Candidatus Rhodobacter lobularis]KMW57852.1 hypothetical protein AIOL_002820 [Candidatus Rhodobacter lobularis]
MQTPEDFTKFYYKKVGLGEGCGCAERVIDMHEFDRAGGINIGHAPRVGLLRRIWRVLTRRA